MVSGILWGCAIPLVTPLFTRDNATAAQTSCSRADQRIRSRINEVGSIQNILHRTAQVAPTFEIPSSDIGNRLRIRRIWNSSKTPPIYRF